MCQGQSYVVGNMVVMRLGPGTGLLLPDQWFGLDPWEQTEVWKPWCTVIRCVWQVEVGSQWKGAVVTRTGCIGFFLSREVGAWWTPRWQGRLCLS